VHVSAATAWEIATKHRLGRFPGVEPLLDDLPGVLRAQQCQLLPILHHHAIRAGGYQMNHRDPHRWAEDFVFLCHESNVLYEH
jgi:PIN domain nuclease of toxin-antitoxin system